MSITLAQLRTEARQRADMSSSEFVTDSELTGYINNSISELHDMLIQAYDGDYYTKVSPEFTTSGSESEYALATIITANDFYKIRGVDAKLNSQEWSTIKPFNFNERNKNQRNSGIVFRYDIVGTNLRFSPIPQDNVQVRIWYVPVAQTLVNDSDTYDDLNNYSEYIIVDAAIKMLQKEESDVSVLERQKVALKRRIEEAANNRDVGEGEAVRDIYDENWDNWYIYGNII